MMMSMIIAIFMIINIIIVIVVIIIIIVTITSTKWKYGDEMSYHQRWGTETVRYGDSAGNTIEENSSIFSLIRMH